MSLDADKTQTCHPNGVVVVVTYGTDAVLAGYLLLCDDDFLAMVL